MTITSNGAILQRTIISEGVMFIFRQVVIGSTFPSDPKQQVLYIVGSVMKYWNGSAWVIIGGGGSTVHNDLTGRNAANAHPASSISGLATVATSGSYNDLSDTPTIPTKLTATITIAVADWAGGTTCVKTVLGLLTTDTVLKVMDAANSILYGNARIFGDSSSTAGQITFTCTTTPTSQIVIPIEILRY